MYLPESLYLHGLNLFPQFGPARLMRLAKGFDNFEQAFFASSAKLVSAGIEPELAELFCLKRTEIDLANEAEKLEKENIYLLTFRDKNFPKLLLEIPKLPPLLYYRGTMDNNDELCLAVVGTRQITSYGRMAIGRLVQPLVEAGACVVSGLAFGADAAAHEVAIKLGRRTIAVLGGGLDEASLYPKAHGLLARQLLDSGGALLSEYPPGMPNFKQNFVARNRIISGLCPATLIIECDLKSGTLITAKHALEQNRQVYAVPGSIFSQQSLGPNNLIKMGAKLVCEAKDILEDLNLQALPEQQEVQQIWGDSAEENALLKVLTGEPLLLSEIIKQSGLNAAAATSALTFLEMKGKVKNLGGQQYARFR